MTFRTGFQDHTPRHRSHSQSRSRSGADSRSSSRARSDRPASDSRSPNVEKSLFLKIADLAALIGLFAVILAFGGRTPIGQLLLCITVIVAMTCIGLHRLFASATPYHWTGAELVVAALLGVGLLQVYSFDFATIQSLSPYLTTLMAGDLYPDQLAESGGWHTLSLTPSETKLTLIPILGVGLFWLLSTQRFLDRTYARRSILIVCFGISALSVFGVLQLLLSNGKFFWVIDHPYTHTLTVAKGPWTNSNHFAGLLALAIGPLLAWSVSSTPQTRSRSGAPEGVPADMRFILGGIALVAILLGIILTGSRGGLLLAAVSVVISLTLIVVCRLADAKLPILLALFGLAGLGTVGVFGQQMLDRNVHELVELDAENLDQGNARGIIWATNLRAQEKFRWFGMGLGSHRHVIPAFHETSTEGQLYTHAENSYLQIGTENGVIGWGILGLSMLLIGWSLLRNFRSEEITPQDRPFLVGITASVAVFLVHGCYDFAWYTPGYMLVMALFTAYILVLRKSSGLSDFLLRIRIPTGACALSVAGIMAWYSMAITWPAARAEPLTLKFQHYTAQSKQFERTEDELKLLKVRTTLLRKSLQVYPHDIDNHIRMAGLLQRVYEIREQHGAFAMPLPQIRAAVYAGGFQDSTQLNEWLNNEAVMKAGLPLVKASLAHARMAQSLCPLRVEPDLVLSEFCFITSPNYELSEYYLLRGERAEPQSADIPFLRGYTEWNRGDFDAAMVHWKPVFASSPRVQKRLINLLSPALLPEQLVGILEPSPEVLLEIVKGYKEHQEAAYPQAAVILADKTIEALPSLPPGEVEPSVSAAYSHLNASNNVPATIQFIRQSSPAVEDSLELRKSYGRFLLQHDQYQEAESHLAYCAQRVPGDSQLKDLLNTARQKSDRLRLSSGMPSSRILRR